VRDVRNRAESRAQSRRHRAWPVTIRSADHATVDRRRAGLRC